MVSFYKKSTGWEFRLRYKDLIENKHREKSGSGYVTKKEAQKAAAYWEDMINKGFRNDKPKLVDYLRWWILEHQKGKWRGNTKKSYVNALDNHIEPYFKNLLLSDLDEIIYQRFLNKLVDDGLSKSSNEKSHIVMVGALNKAVQQGRIKANPCIGVNVLGKSNDEEMKYIEPDQLPEFLKVAKQDNPIYYLFFKMLLETGMRKGEAAALQWKDIDMNERTISINKTLNFYAVSLMDVWKSNKKRLEEQKLDTDDEEKEELFGDTKTFNSKRVITISDSLIKDLEAHLIVQNYSKLVHGDLYQHELDLVNCRPNGAPFAKSTLFNAFRRILKRAQIERMSIHSLRHTHVVLLLEAEADLNYIKERLGHGSIQITSDVYAHVSKKINNRNIKRYENLIKDIF